MDFEGDHYLIRKPLGLNNNSVIDNVLDSNDDDATLNQTNKNGGLDPNEVLPIKNCTRAAILELPPDGLTRDERQHGWIVIHLLLACYCFWLLATICNEYFVPAIEAMCCSEFNFVLINGNPNGIKPSLFFFFFFFFFLKQHLIWMKM